MDSPKYRVPQYAGLGSIILDSNCNSDDLHLLVNSEEAYKLSITQTQVIVKALSAHGLFNGVQSLIQKLPAKPSSDIRLNNCEVSRCLSSSVNLNQLLLHTSSGHMTSSWTGQAERGLGVK